MTVQCSFLCAARTLFEWRTDRKSKHSCVPRASVFCAFSTQKPVCVCCTHTP